MEGTQTMARQKKQPNLPGPGMAPPSIPVLEEKAQQYRDLVTERMALQVKEEAAKAELIDEVHTQVKKGNLTVPPKSESDVVPIYTFVDSEGEKLVLKWGRQEKVKVNKAKEPRPGAELVV